MAEMAIVWDDAVIDSLGDRDAALVALTDRLAAEAVGTMKRLCPVSPVGPLHRSGTLRSSIRAFRSANRHGRYITVGPTADYGRYVNDGTVPHVIESHGPWPLRNRETGHAFGRVVHHPGTTGSHFVERTAATFEGRTYHV